MLRLFVFLGAAAAAAGCSDTCTHPGVKVFEMKTDISRAQDCSGYGPGLSTPATADECKTVATAANVLTQEQIASLVSVNAPTNNFNSCGYDTVQKALLFGIGTGTSETAVSQSDAQMFCKCSACPPPAKSPPPPPTSSSTGTGWTLLGIALGAGSAGGAIAYGAAQAP
jgi:hypothetical protein